MNTKEQGLPDLPPGLEGWLSTHQRVLLRECIEAEVAKRAALASDTGERGVPAIDVFRIAGGDVECCPEPTAEQALECLRDLRECYAEALRAQPAGGGDATNAPGSRAWMHDVVMAAAAHIEVEGNANAHLPKIAHWILAAPAQPDGVSK